MTDNVNEEKEQGLDQADISENLKNEEDLNKESAQEDIEEKVEDEAESDSMAKENQELKDKYVRLYSEFENYRRRTAKEKLDMISKPDPRNSSCNG